MIKCNEGYKTKKAKEIGAFVGVEGKLIENRNILPSHKVVYAYLKAHMNINTKQTCISIDTLTKKTCYSRRTIVNAIAELSKQGVIVISKRSSEMRPGHLEHNVYEFPLKGNAFYMITLFFLSSQILSVKEKEFLLLLFPYILGNDTIGAVGKPATISVIAKMIGLTYITVSKRIEGLRQKQLISEHYTRINMYNDKEFVGYRIDMRTIMIDNADNILRESMRIRTIAEDYGLNLDK